jgi:hypothetical protein
MVHQQASADFPAFPDGIICGHARRFVDLYAPIREVPKQFLWLAFITYFGNAISPHVRLDIDYSEPRLFAAVIGQSARTKKSTGNTLALELFRDALRATGKQAVIQGFGSSEGLLKALSDKGKLPTMLHLDEINILASKTAVEGSVGISALHQLFEQHDYDHPLSSGKIPPVRDAFLSMLGASTLEDFRMTWNSKHKDAGFFSRLLLVGGDCTDKRISRPVRADQTARDALVSAVRSAIERISQRSAATALKLAPDAEESWDRFYGSMGVGREWDRIDTYGFRLMTIQAVLKGEQVVSKETVQQVIEFLQYEVAIRKILQPIIAENPIAEMEELIMRHLPASGQRVSHRDLSRKTNASRKGVEIFKRAISNLAADDRLKKWPKNTANGTNYEYQRVEESAQEDEHEAQAVIGSVITAPDDTPRHAIRQDQSDLAEAPCEVSSVITASQSATHMTCSLSLSL